MKYYDAPDLRARTVEIVKLLDMKHIALDRIECIRSTGTSTTHTIARCHTLGKVMQHGMKTGAFYTIEFLELFEKQSMEGQDNTIIHELMHIPKAFGGGFRHHDYVCDGNVEKLHAEFKKLKKGIDSTYLMEEPEQKKFLPSFLRP